MSAGEHEMRDYHAPQDAPRPTINQTPDFKPYLGLRARLSQIWLNRWTILLLLVLVRLMFAMKSTDESLVSARREALSACTQVEKLGSSMASMPHYMSKGVNEMTASSVEKAVAGLMKMLDMSVAAVGEIVLFVIHMYTQTYMCLLTLVATGSAKLALNLAKEVTELLTKSIDEATDDIGKAASTVTDGINDLMSKTNIPFLGGFKKPQINIDEPIKKLKDIKMPDDAIKKIDDLKNKIPNFDQVQNATDELIKTPFNKVRELIQGMNKYEFDRSLLPVPQKETLNFCSEGNSINGFFDDLIAMVANGKKLAIGLLIAAAILVCAPMAWQEIRRYRKMQERSALFAEGHDAMDVVYLASRPTSSGMGLWFGRRFGSARRQAVIRWAWAYATSPPMLFVLSVGAAGLFSCFCQYLLLKAIEDKAPELTEQVADFAGKVVKSVDNASMSWSTGVNNAIKQVDGEINDQVFGWVNETTSALNKTVNVLVDTIDKTLTGAFGGTLLEDPVKDVVRCIIGLKLEGIQKGLNWVSDNAHISFPGVRNDTLSLSSLAEKSDSDSAADLLADPSGKAKDEISEAVNYVIRKMMSGLTQEALISTALILIWLLVAIGGYIYAAVQLFRRDPYAARAYNIDQDIAAANEPKPEDYDAAAPPSYVANDYNVNKAAPYTLSSRPFPTFDAEPESEKVGQVTARQQIHASSRPGHLRASSHGDLTDPSPLDERDRSNPFSDNNYPREK